MEITYCNDWKRLIETYLQKYPDVRQEMSDAAWAEMQRLFSSHNSVEAARYQAGARAAYDKRSDVTLGSLLSEKASEHARLIDGPKPAGA